MHIKTLNRVQTIRETGSLSSFVQDAWHVVEPSTLYIGNWHIDAICEHLEAVSAGQIRNLVINMPPRHMKSLLVSVFWPCWEWTIHPQRRWIFASYAQSIANRDSVKCRRLIDSPWYQNLYGDIYQLTSDQNQKMRFDNDKTGCRLSTSVGGIGTGEGGDRVVVDDPHRVSDAESRANRTNTLEWWDETMSSRCNDPKTSARVIVMQRVHEKDLTGHVLHQGGYDHLCLPAEYEGSTKLTSIGWPDPRTKIGELICERRYGPGELAELKLRLGSRAASAQLQQRPSPAEGAIFKLKWFENTYADLPIFDRIATFWDTAVKANEESDETACLTLGVTPAGDSYVLRLHHGKWETPDVAAFLVKEATRYKSRFGKTYHGDYVEDKVSGSTLLQYICRTNRELVVRPINVESDKISRAHGVTPLCEAGRVLLPNTEKKPETKQWVDDLLANITTFPAAANDDITDVFVYAIKWSMQPTPQPRPRSRRGGFV